MYREFVSRARLLSLVLAAALGIAACGGEGPLGEMATTQSAAGDEGTKRALSAARSDMTALPPTPVPVPSRLSKRTVTVNGTPRDYHFYLPSNLEALKAVNLKNIRIVVSFHDQGQTSEDNARETRWHELGEANGFVVIYPDALNGNWNTTLATTGPDEVAYIQAAWTDIRQTFNISDTNAVYPTGFGAGAQMAHQLAMMGTVIGYMAPISAVAGIDGVADPAVLALPRTIYTYPATPGAVVLSPTTPFGRSIPATAMSVWVLQSKSSTAAVGAQVEYWKGMNSVSATPAAANDVFFDTTVYRSEINAFQEVRVSTFKTPRLSGKALSQYLWTNMFNKVIRFKDDDRQNGSLHLTQTSEQMGILEQTRDFSQPAGGNRRFLTYLPSNYAALTAGGSSIPLVFNFHGIRGSGWWQATVTDWVPTAERHGFIAVFPQGVDANFSSSINQTPTVNYDVQFILELITYLKSQYNIDSSRIFVSGVSAGAQFTNRIAMEYPQLFAGAAPCYSGHLSANVYNNSTAYPQIRTDLPMPIWQCRGGTEPDSAFPGGASGQEAARRFWRVTVNGYPAAVNEEAAVPTSTVTLGPESRRHLKYFVGAKARYVWQTTDYVPHFWHPGGQADLMWTEMFSHYRRNADGALTYSK